MATRFYFPASAPFAVFTPSVDAGWGYTSEVTRHELARAKSNSALTVGTRVGAWSNTAATKAIDRQLFSPPLAAQSISGTVSMMAMAREFATSDNVDRLYLAIKVVDAAGSVVATLLSFGTATGAATTELLATAVRCATWANGATLSSYSCSAGDRIMVEVGFSNSTTGTSPEAQINWGDPTAGTDATVGDNTTTTARVGWLEFSANLTFSSPTVSAVSPTNGKAGQAITVTGTGFMPGSTVTVGGASATSVVYVNQTSITCVVPSGTVGAQDVVVTNTDSLTGTLVGGFTYNPPGPTEVVFTNAGGSQIEHWELYNSSGNYIGTFGVGSTFNQPNAGNRPAVDTAVSPAGKTLLSFDGNDMVGDFGTGGIIATGAFPTWASPNIVVEHFVVYLPSTPDNSTIMMMIDLDSDGWNRNQFGSGIIYRTGALSDAPLSGATPHFVTCEHNCSSGVSTMTINGVAQTTTGTNSSSTRTDFLNYKLIGAKGDLSDGFIGHIGGYGIGYGTTWGSTERAALYQAQQDWFNGVASGVTGTLASTLAPLTVTATGSAPVTASLNATLAPLTVSAAGSAPVTATVGSTLGELTVAAFGSSVTPVTATLNVTLGELTVAATASAPSTGTANVTLAALSVVAVASAPVTGTLNVNLAPMTVSPATASAVDRGSLNTTLAALTVVSTAAATVRGSLNVTFAPLTIVAIATAPSTGSLSSTLAPLTIAALGGQDVLPVFATLDVTLQPLTIAATASAPARASASVTLEGLTVVVLGSAPVRAQLSVTLGPLAVAGVASAPTAGVVAVSLAALTVVAIASSPVRAELEVTLAPLTVVAVGGWVSPLETSPTLFWHLPTYSTAGVGLWPPTIGPHSLTTDGFNPPPPARNGYPSPTDTGDDGSLQSTAIRVSDVLGAGEKTLFAYVELTSISSDRLGQPDAVWLGGALFGDLYDLYLGLFVYRTGTGPFQYWLSYYEWDGARREAKVEITHLLDANGGGRLIAQGRKVNGFVQVRVNDGDWVQGPTPCGDTEDVSGFLATAYVWPGFAGTIKSLGTWDRAITDAESHNLYAFANTLANTVFGRLEVTLQPMWVEASNIFPDLGPPTHTSVGRRPGALVDANASPLGVVVSAPVTVGGGVVVRSVVRPAS